MSLPGSPVPFEAAPFASPALNALLALELAAGNQIVEDGPGWGEMQRLMLLKLPFQTPTDDLANSVVFRAVNDPHYWLAEVEDLATRELLACRFAPFGKAGGL